MHGEKVSFGTLTQLALEDRPTEESNDTIEFCMNVGLPTTLVELDLGKATSKDHLLTAAEAATVPGETIHNLPFAVTPDMLVRASAKCRNVWFMGW
jgi:glycerol dehydrogenase